MYDSQADYDYSQDEADPWDPRQSDDSLEWWMEQDAIEERKLKEAKMAFWDNFSESVRKVL